MLTWPPAGDPFSRPHPAVLERQSSKILEHLANHTLTAVEARVRERHVLVAMPSSDWPDNFFSFMACLRKALPGAGCTSSSSSSAPPVVVLRKSEPSAEDWGTVGHFGNVFFVKGSPLSEFDLMRAGVFSACKGTESDFTSLLAFLLVFFVCL